jgi:O-antigen/teichoic acid export membrane protein
MTGARVWLGRVFPKGGFARNVAVLAGGTALGQAVVVLASPILTRLYTPEDFGALAVYASILLVLVVVASFRYELAIPLPGDDNTAGHLLLLALAIVVGLSLLSGLGIWLLGARIVSWVNTPNLERYLWLLPMSLLGAGIYQALSYWAIRMRAFRQIALTKLNQGLGMVLTQIGVGLLQGGPMGLVLGDVVGRVCGSGTLAALALRSERRLPNRIEWRNLSKAAFRYRRFPLISSGGSLLNTMGLNLPPLLLAVLYGPQVAGWFALGQRVLGVPMALVGQAVAKVYLGEISRLKREDPTALRPLFRQTALRLFLLGAPLIVILVLGGPWIFAWVFGEGWRQSGVYLQILGAMFLAQFVVVPLSQTLNVLERQDLQLAWDAGRLVLTVGVLVAASFLQFSDVQAVGLYGVAMLLAYVALFALSDRTLVRTFCAGRSLGDAG